MSTQNKSNAELHSTQQSFNRDTVSVIWVEEMQKGRASEHHSMDPKLEHGMGKQCFSNQESH